VEVRAFSINRGELRMLGPAADGWRPGWDFAGILRSDVEGGLRAGSRVVGIRQGGTWAERVAVPRSNVVPKPASLSFAEAACLPTAWLTAYRMLFTRGDVVPGMTVLVQGAGGGVATALTVLGSAAGVRVWVTSRSAEKREQALALGAVTRR